MSPPPPLPPLTCCCQRLLRPMPCPPRPQPSVISGSGSECRAGQGGIIEKIYISEIFRIIGATKPRSRTFRADTKVGQLCVYRFLKLILSGLNIDPVIRELWREGERERERDSGPGQFCQYTTVLSPAQPRQQDLLIGLSLTSWNCRPLLEEKYYSAVRATNHQEILMFGVRREGDRSADV